MSWSFEAVAGPFPHPLGGLVADGDTGVLFSSVDDSRILRLEIASGDISVWRRFTSRTSGLARAADGTVYACQEGSRRVAALHADGSATVTAVTLDGRYHNFPSDATVDARGRVWFTDTFHESTAFGPQIFPPLPFTSILRAERGANHRWGLKRIGFDSIAPRALALSPDERTLYVAEGTTRADARRELRAYPVIDDVALGASDILMTFGADARGAHRGIEGLCVDASGCLVACGGWNASGPGPCVYVFSPTGRLVEAHSFTDDLPVRCAFAGPGRASLYVTTRTGRLWRATDTGRNGPLPSTSVAAYG